MPEATNGSISLAATLAACPWVGGKGCLLFELSFAQPGAAKDHVCQLQAQLTWAEGSKSRIFWNEPLQSCLNSSFLVLPFLSPLILSLSHLCPHGQVPMAAITPLISSV